MAKTTTELSGERAQKYLDELIRSHGDMPAATIERLAQSCRREIANVRVRLPLPDRTAASGAAKTKGKGAAKAAAAASPVQVAAPTKSAASAAALPTPAAASPAKPFDPFAFSLVVVLTKEGRDGLAARLAAIDDAAHLKALAKAQHVALDPAAATVDALRASIIEGTSKRIADRRAAAS